MADYQQDKFIESGRRFNNLRKILKLSQKQVAEIVGGNQGNVSAVISGRRALPTIWIYRLKEKYVILNETWLLSGKGEMFIDEENTEENKEENTPMLLMETVTKYANAKPLNKDQMEQMLARLAYRVGELEEWKKEMEEKWRELSAHLLDGDKDGK